MTTPTKRWIKIAAGLAVSIACLAFIFFRADLDALLLALSSFQWVYLFPAIAALSIDYSLRIVRWAYMLRQAGANVSTKACTPAFLGSMALNNVLPLRAGDIVRALVFPLSLGVSRTASTATIVLERVLDFLVLMILFGVGVFLSPHLQIPVLDRTFLVTLCALVGGALFLLVFFADGLSKATQWLIDFSTRKGRSRMASLLAHFRHLMQSLILISRVRILASLNLLSILVWLANAGLFLAVLHGFSIPSTPAAALVVMAIATLSTLVPSSPGYVGPFHLAAYASAIMLDATPAAAAAFALVSHFVLWLPVTIAGLCAMVLNPSLFEKNARESANTE